MITKKFQIKLLLSAFLITFVKCMEPFHNKHNNIVTFYEHSNFQGLSNSFFVLNKCQTLASFMLNKASSINTHGNCIMVFSRDDCKGKPIYFKKDGTSGPERVSHKSFAGTQLNDKARSFVLCPIKYH